jgi:geranylgeranyl pyrophosphate synthase
MLSIPDQVKAVQEIMGESLGFYRAALFPELAGLAARAVRGGGRSGERPPWLMLPILTCDALGGDLERAHHVAAALEIGRLAAGILDSWQDQDTDDALWQTVGPAPTVNLATSMIGLSQLTLTRLVDLGVDRGMAFTLMMEFSQTLIHMCEGQHADLTDHGSLSSYQRIVGAKTGSLLSLGCRAGALVAEASAEVAECYGEFGCHLGVLAQVWNDFQGLLGIGGKSDLEQQRGLPILATLALEDAGYTPESAEGQAGRLYALAQFQALHERAAGALAECPAPGLLTRYLEGYSVNHLLRRAALRHRLYDEEPDAE